MINMPYLLGSCGKIRYTSKDAYRFGMQQYQFGWGRIGVGLFDRLNPALFKPLAGCYRAFFADLLDILWSRCKHSKNYSMEKDEMTEIAEQYFETIAMEMTLEEEEGSLSDRENAPQQASPVKDPHTQALWFLNRLRATGWLEDLDGGYGEAMRTAVVARVVPLMQAFHTVLHPQTVTYSGKLFKAYQLFKTLGQDTSPYENILKEVSTSMDELNDALRNLNASIGAYIEKMTRNKTPQQVLELFEEYEDKIVIAAYHRFKTSDNLFLYRADLQAALDLCEDQYMDALIDDYSKVEQVDREQAAGAVMEVIQKVRDDLDIMTALMREIDRNHTSYRKRAVQRAQFMLLTDSSLQGTINDLLKYYAETIQTAEEMDEVDDSPLSARWNLYPVDLLGKNFLKKPAQQRGPLETEPLEMPELLSEEELNAAQKQLLAYAAAAVTQENVNAFAQQILRQKEAIQVSEVAKQEPDEFVKIIALHTYSQSKSRNYDIELQSHWVQCGKMRFQDFILKKKV